MPFQDRATRRTFFGGLGALIGTLATSRRAAAMPAGPALDIAQSTAPLRGFGATGDVYRELGVTTVINGQGTMTTLGGSLMRPEVEAVMALAGQNFVSVPELEIAAGKRISAMLELPEGYAALVTSGAAAAMQSGLAGILTGSNPKFIEQLPDLTGMKSEVLIQRSHRNPFDHQLRSTGVRLVVVESREDVARAITPQTAMMHFTNYAAPDGQIGVEEWVKLAHGHGIPAFIDAAADTPPVSRLRDYATMGYDLIAFSGGKAIRGPQCAGLLIGRADLVGYALLNNCPYEDTIGRSQKVGKEEIVGMVKALESYLAEDHEALAREWRRRLDVIASQLATIPGVITTFPAPGIANHVPHLRISWDGSRIARTAHDVDVELRRGTPSIVLATSDNGAALTMNSFMLKPGEEQIIARALVAALRPHAANASLPLQRGSGSSER